MFPAPNAAPGEARNATSTAHDTNSEKEGVYNVILIYAPSLKRADWEYRI